MRVIRNPRVFPDGTAAAPAGFFGTDPDTGFYLVSAGVFGIASGGTGELRVDGTSASPVSNDGLALGTTSLMWSDLFLADESVINFNNGDMTITHGSNYMSIAGGLVVINDTANAQMTVGLTINQATNDDEVLALKSADVAHGITDATETDTFATFKKQVGANGGLQIAGYTDSGPGTSNIPAMHFKGYGAADNTAKTTGAAAHIELFAATKSGTGIANVGSDGNLVDIENNGTVRFIFDAEGSGHADVEWVAYAHHDDIALMADIERHLLAREDEAKTYRRKALEEMKIIGKDSWHFENGKPRAMVNFTKLAMLHHGALLQAGERIMALESKVNALTERN
jgi:hypothetical protein